MENIDLGYKVLKYKDTEKTVHYFDENGNDCVKTEKVTNNLIMIKDNGDSIVGTVDYFKQLGIVIPKDLETFNTKTTKSGIIKDNLKGNKNVEHKTE